MKIPKGWRKLRRGTMIRNGDKYFNPYGPGDGEWFNVQRWGYAVGFEIVYIRRISP